MKRIFFLLAFYYAKYIIELVVLFLNFMVDLGWSISGQCSVNRFRIEFRMNSFKIEFSPRWNFEITMFVIRKLNVFLLEIVGEQNENYCHRSRRWIDRLFFRLFRQGTNSTIFEYRTTILWFMIWENHWNFIIFANP